MQTVGGSTVSAQSVKWECDVKRFKISLVDREENGVTLRTDSISSKAGKRALLTVFEIPPIWSV